MSKPIVTLPYHEFQALPYRLTLWYIHQSKQAVMVKHGELVIYVCDKKIGG
jgi:hypothetical protein